MANTLMSLYGVYSNPYRYGAVKATSAIGKALLGYTTGTTTNTPKKTTDQVNLSNYGKTLSALETFRTSLNGIRTVQSVAPFAATSSNKDALTAEASEKTLAAATYAVNVNNLATAHTLDSQTFANKDTTIIGTGTLTIETGAYNSTALTYASKTSTSITISAGNGTLTGIAEAINNADAGVIASIHAATGGGYQLRLTSTETGTDHVMRVSATPPTGSTTTGLSAFAFNPLGTKTMTEKTAAQNATVNVGAAATSSQSNEVTTAITGVTLSLEGTGASTVKVTRDGDAFAKAAKSFVDAYNTLQKSLKESNTGQADGLLNKIGNDVSNNLFQASAGFGNNRVTLSDIGISKNADGTLSLSATKAKAALTANPENAAKVLANTAEKLSTVAAQDSSTNSSLQSAIRSLNRSVQSNNTANLTSSQSSTVYGSAMSQARLYAMISSML